MEKEKNQGQLQGNLPGNLPGNLSGNWPCRRCLTRDMDQGEYFKNLHTYIANLDEDIRTDEALYEKRLSLCRECDRLLDGMCRACGCFVELRAAIGKNVCPYSRW